MSCVNSCSKWSAGRAVVRKERIPNKLSRTTVPATALPNHKAPNWQKPMSTWK